MNFLKIKDCEGFIHIINPMEISRFEKMTNPIPREFTPIYMRGGKLIIADMPFKELELLLGEGGVAIHGLPIG